MSSGASYINNDVASRGASGVSNNAEDEMLNQSDSGFGASAANKRASGSAADLTMSSEDINTSTKYPSSSSSNSSSSSSHGHNHHHHHSSSSSSSLFGGKNHHHHSSHSGLSSDSSSSLSSEHTGHHHHSSTSSLSSGSNSMYGSSYGSTSALSSSSLSSGSTSTYGTSYSGRNSAPSVSSTFGNGHGTDHAMTRSEEQLLVGKERVETGAAALKKTIQTEHVQTNIPLIREKVVLEREPISEANRGAAYSGSDLKEAEHIVTVTEERPIVEKEVVAKERVRLDKVAEVTNQTVGGEIRKERIEFDQGSAPMANTSTWNNSSSGSNLENSNMNNVGIGGANKNNYSNSGLRGTSNLSGSSTATDNSEIYNKDRIGTDHQSDLARKEANY